MNWKITKNTDSVDIRSECVGLDSRRLTIPKDIAEHIHTNRGLHIQIRHNSDSQTFAQANDLARLIAAAPEMLKECKYALEFIQEWARVNECAHDQGYQNFKFRLKRAIAKAEGES